MNSSKPANQVSQSDQMEPNTKPDLFITFTCNPKWKEIQENLMPRQTSWDRPDIVCRVFKKLDEFLDYLYKKACSEEQKPAFT